jgi:hypothetical protein
MCAQDDIFQRFQSGYVITDAQVDVLQRQLY